MLNFSSKPKCLFLSQLVTCILSQNSREKLNFNVRSVVASLHHCSVMLHLNVVTTGRGISLYWHGASQAWHRPIGLEWA